MAVGLAYDGMWPLEDFIKLAKAAEQEGVESIWIAEHFLYRDALAIAALVLNTTKNIRVIPGPLSPYSRHLIVMAMAALTLAELGGERFCLHLGTGNRVAQETFGVIVTKPLEVMEESINSIRALLNGKTVSTRDGFLKLNQVQMKFGFPKNVPIYMAAIGPKMLTLARLKADGTVISAVTSPAFVHYSVKISKEAISLPQAERHEVVGFILASVNEQKRKALNQIRPLMAYMLRTDYLRKDWMMNDLQIDHRAIYEAIERKDMPAACDLVDDISIQTLTASGTPAEFQAKLEAYLQAGIDLPVIFPSGDISTKIKTIKLAVDVCDRF
jgi:5,10-methylenetetrahydromethanopterin reductase